MLQPDDKEDEDYHRVQVATDTAHTGVNKATQAGVQHLLCDLLSNPWAKGKVIAHH